MNRNMRYRPNSGSGSLGTYRNLELTREHLQHREGKQQQKMALNEPFNRKRQYGNEHPSQNYVPYNANQGGVQNYAYLYDNGPGLSFDRGYIPNKKRQKINVWDIDMFGTNQNPGIQRNNTYTVRQNSPPRPLMSLPGLPPKIRRIPNVPPKAHKSFVPSKATKSFKSKPIDQPIQSSAQPADKEQYILRADKVPCQQMVGRLELALGSILKEMKASLCTNTEIYSLFTSKVIQRSIKQTIRERIKSVMLNKHIGKYVDIIEAYRKHFPQNTDKDVLDMAVIKTGASEQHVKQSFDKILIKKVNIMFKKLQVLVEEKDMEVAQLIEARQIFKDDKKTEEDIKQSVKIESDYYLSVVDSLLGARLPKILPNYASCIVKMLKRQGFLNDTNGDDANNDDSGPIELPDSDVEVDKEENLEAEKELNTDPIIIDDEIEYVQDEKMAKTNDMETTKDVSGENIKEDDNAEKATIKGEPGPNPKANGNNDINTDLSEVKLDSTDFDNTSKEKNTSASSLFLVKVLCQPELPTKAEAYKFLKKFNMVNVKKHKAIQNLLVVEVGNEKDYNDILAASGTVIEKSTLIIKGNKPQQEATTSASKSEMEMKEDQSSKDNQLLTPELENQITDLLTSINEQTDTSNPNTSNEGDTEMTNEEAKPEDNTTLYSATYSYNEETKCETIKEADESQEDEQAQDPVDSGAAEAAKETDKDENSEGVESKSEDNDKSPVVEPSVIATDVEEKSADVDKTPAESIDKADNEENTGSAMKINKEAKSTPVRSSSRLASTPINVRTRRASRLAQIN